MLGITKNKVGNSLRLQLTGTIDEDVDWNAQVGEPGKELQVHCYNVLRINSVGVKNWQVYFDKLRLRGVRLVFSEIAPCLMEQTSYIRDFIPKAEMESICVPYYCNSCNLEIIKISPLKELEAEKLSELVTACSQCGKQVEADLDSQEYFFSILQP